MKKILGLDLGTNSIGWAVVCHSDTDGQTERKWIEMAGSRIIPMDAAILGDFDKGNSKSQTSERTGFRGIRRLRERVLLRRERLHKVLKLIGFLPQHYIDSLDFSNHSGKFQLGTEVKLPWRKNEIGKYEFLFQNSFNEMLADFAKKQPELVAMGRKVPYDWTIYYLRKKALSEKITKEELAWILLNFNQKRGYYQLRGEEEEEKKNRLEDFYALKVVEVEQTDDKKGKDIWYNVHLENGWIYRRSSNVPLDWKDKIKEFIVMTELNEDGTPKVDKDGCVKRSFRMPKEDDWKLLKKKTEADIERSHKTIGCYIYDTLLQSPQQKIKGKLVRTIERKFYKDELKLILDKQQAFHPELQDRELYKACLDVLYPMNVAHKNNVANRGFVYLFMEDILFYQRPLKSKKSLIDNCPYEENQYIDVTTGEIKKAPIKCIAKSHPLYQEFRLWQFIANIRIYQKEKKVDGKLLTDIDVTTEYLSSKDDYVALYEWLCVRKEIEQKTFLKYPAFGLKKEIENYRWNYVEGKSYPCNETRSLILHYLVSNIKNAERSFDWLENLLDNNGFFSQLGTENIAKTLTQLQDVVGTEYLITQDVWNSVVEKYEKMGIGLYAYSNSISKEFIIKHQNELDWLVLQRNPYVQWDLELINLFLKKYVKSIPESEWDKHLDGSRAIYSAIKDLLNDSILRDIEKLYEL